ncbi:protein of unknown function [Methylococcus capsulatus]|uniref:Uncharacterized protein n=1 Tax=Methylococcus capsulatus TaxID=414 RepID=A0AA35UKH1_METCP|nr:protein of unknown function [Methylococcus capsulatus]
MPLGYRTCHGGVFEAESESHEIGIKHFWLNLLKLCPIDYTQPPLSVSDTRGGLRYCEERRD